MVEKNSPLGIGITFLRSVLDTLSGPTPAAQPGAPTQGAKAKLADVTLEQLEHEKASIEHSMLVHTEKVKKLEAKKRQLLSQALNCTSDREKLMYARNIKEVDTEAASYDALLATFYKKKSLLNGVLVLKRRELALASTGVTSLSNVDMDEIMMYAKQISERGIYEDSRVDRLLDEMGVLTGVGGPAKEDQDVLQILDMINKAQEAGEQSVDKLYDTMQEKQKDKDEFEPF